MTIMEKVLTVLAQSDAPFMTAADIQRSLPDELLSSLGSALCKLANHRVIVRVRKAGPRGGQGYHRRRDWLWHACFAAEVQFKARQICSHRVMDPVFGAWCIYCDSGQST